MLNRLLRISRGACARTVGFALSSFRPGSVVVLHQHRCGSTVLSGMLRDHPKITWHFEIATFHRLRYEQTHGSDEGWTCSPEQLIRRRQWGNPFGWFGCEITTRNAWDLGMSLAETVEMLERRGFTRFVVLERRNHLRRYISSQVAETGGKLHRNRGEGAERRTVTLDPASTGLSRDFLPLLEVLRRDTQEIGELLRLTERFDPLHVVYEDHIRADPTVGYNMICQAMGLATRPAAPKIEKTNPYPVRQMLENFEEVAAELRGSPYAWMLDD